MSAPVPVKKKYQSSDFGFLSGSPVIYGDGSSVHASNLSPYEARMLGPRTLSVSFRRKSELEPDNVLWKQQSLPGSRHHSSSLIEDGSVGVNVQVSPVAHCPNVAPFIGVNEQDVPCTVEVAKSSFRETLINAINVLLGVGVLSLPYAAAKGGWAVAVMLLLISLTASYTAIILGRMQRDVISINHATRRSGLASSCNGHYTLVPKENPKDDLERPQWEKGTWSLHWKEDRWWLQDEATGAGYMTSCTTSLKYPLRPDGNTLLQADWEILPGDEEGDSRDAEEATKLHSQDSLGPVLGTLASYPDIGLAAFGNRGHLVLELLFFAELYLFLVGSIILIVENVHHLTSFFSKAELTLLTGILVVPPSMVTDFSKLSILSYFGFMACMVLLFSILYFAFTTDQDLPKGNGSIIKHADDQDTFVFSTFSLGCSLVMSSFGGHSLFPSLRGDMADTTLYPRVVGLSFLVTGTYYVVVVIFGYMMYGVHCNGIIVLNFDQSEVVTKIMLVCIVTVTYSKYGVINHALCCDLEGHIMRKLKTTGRTVPLRVVQTAFRLLITVTAVGLTFVIPSFDMVMSLVGASVSTVISIIFPCSAFLKLCGPRLSRPFYYFNVGLVVTGCYFAVTGTMNTLGLKF